MTAGMTSQRTADPWLSVKRLLHPLLSHPRFAQGLKWFVYIALLINSAGYFAFDLEGWRGALPADASLLDILTQVATSIDTIAWVALIVLFELETYALPDRFWHKWLMQSMQVARVVC